MWLGIPEPTVRLVGRWTGDGERSGELVSGSKSGSCGQFRGNFQPKRVADPGEALFTSRLLPFAVEAGGESERGWRDGIRRDLLWGIRLWVLVVEMSTSESVKFRRVLLVRTLREVAQRGAMRGGRDEPSECSEDWLGV